ncbi:MULTISPECIES: APC family permease [Metallosphaera]|uniref:APC family permease n=1 Tax=Metallosphaera TaxID=41980 RepID=UPI001F06B95D|nr:APC family permease [Metallosphaera sedula]MCH1772177.1 APC family permease [Metallosphaera sedula]MCP6727723.1 APC family permease [Metallosphaera sedula]
MSDKPFKLAKVIGPVAIIASAVSQEYGAGINAVATQSIGSYPAILNLVPAIMFITGLFMLPKVFMYQKFGKVASRSGGQYVWISRTTTPEVGFIVHFLYWIGIVSAIGFISYTVGSTLASTLVSLGISSGAWFATFTGHIVLGLALIWSFFLIHYTGVRSYGVVVTLLFALVLLGAIISMVAGFGTANSVYTGYLSSQIFHGTIPSYTTPPLTYSDIFGTVTLFIFAYAGISAAPLLGGEAKDPKKDMPRGIFLAWLIALVLFTLVSLAVFHAITGGQVFALIKSKYSYYATIPGILSISEPKLIGAIFSIIVTIIIMKTIMPQLLTSSRTLFAWGQDKILPEIFTHTNKFKAPDFSLLVCALFASIYLVYTTSVGVSAVDVRSLSVLLEMMALGAGVLLISTKSSKKEWEKEVTTIGAIIAGLAGIIVTLIIIPSVAVVPHVSILLQPSFQVILVIVIGFLIYEIAKMYNKRTKNIDLNDLIKKELPLE